MKPTILASVDFSTVSLNAAEYAAQLAMGMQANLMLIHVVQIPVMYGEIPMPIGNFDEVIDQAHGTMQGLVRKLDHACHEKIFIQYEIKTGSPVYEIAEWAEKEHPLLVVIGTRGLGNMERFLLGSVSLSLTKECPVPLLVIPEGCKYNYVRKIGFATDLRQVVQKTPDTLIRKFTDLLGAELCIIHNAENYEEYEPAIMEEEILLDAMFTQQRHSFHFTHDEMTEEAIIRFARENQLDWVMILPGKHGFFDELFGHQHTREFVLHAELPVMVLPACA
jgi:nucleotide-binding universal stress UspA family protein